MSLFTNASAPFNSSASKADIILRSSDNIDFHFSKHLLAYSSPFFENLFSDGVPDETKDGRSVITLPDHSADLRRFLSFHHPMLNVEPLETIKQLISFHAILDKYCIEGIDEIVYQVALVSPCIVEAPPIILYAAAIQLGHRALAQLAAKRSLQIPAHELLGNLENDSALANMPARYLNQLARYHRECGAAASTIWRKGPNDSQRYDVQWMSYTLQPIFMNHQKSTEPAETKVIWSYDRNGTRAPLQMIIDNEVAKFLDNVQEALKTCPCTRTVQMAEHVDTMGKAITTPVSSDITVSHVMQVVQETCAEVDRRIAQVEFKLNF